MADVVLGAVALARGIALSSMLDSRRRSGHDPACEHCVSRSVAGPLKSAGVYSFTLTIAVAVTILSPIGWRRGAAFVLLAALVSGLNWTHQVDRRPDPTLQTRTSASRRPFVLQPVPRWLAGAVRVARISVFPRGTRRWRLRRRRRWLCYGPVRDGDGSLVRRCRRGDASGSRKTRTGVSDAVAAAALGIGGVYVDPVAVDQIAEATACETARTRGRRRNANS